MPRKIDEDWEHFRKIIEGKLRKELKKYFKTNHFVKLRPDGKGRISIPLPQIDVPHITYGEPSDGIGRGKGKKGDVIKRDPQPGDGNQAGQDEGEGVVVSVDMDYLVQFMRDELELPDMKPKETKVYEDVKIKYNDISLTGPESLRHNRRTLLQALKRLASSDELDKLHYLPGMKMPMKLITPINSDKRYRQYKEIRIPTSNAVIMFGRDGSASMDEEKCEIVSDTAFWIDMWIRQFHEKVLRCYFWHDTVAYEVDEEKFYKYRYGGGTTCSSCLKLMAKQLENRFPPDKWNIYCFYFSDGENWSDDNDRFMKVLHEEFNPNVCNLFGITQVLAWSYGYSLKKYVDDNLKESATNVRTVSIGPEETPDFNSASYWSNNKMSEEERNEAVKTAIKTLLRKQKISI